jgi:hypothetical protein
MGELGLMEVNAEEGFCVTHRSNVLVHVLEPYIEGSPICSAAPGSMPYFARGLRDSFDR